MSEETVIYGDTAVIMECIYGIDGMNGICKMEQDNPCTAGSNGEGIHGIYGVIRGIKTRNVSAAQIVNIQTYKL